MARTHLKKRYSREARAHISLQGKDDILTTKKDTQFSLKNEMKDYHYNFI